MPKYPELEDLMSGWFHLDFDLHGNTLEEVIEAYLQVASSQERRTLVDDIDRFLRDSQDVDADFQSVFRPHIIPTSFAPTTRDFLERIAALAKP